MLLKVRVSPPDAERATIHVKLPTYQMQGDIALDGTVVVYVPDADIPPPKLVLARSAGLTAEDAAHNLFRTLSDRTAWHDHLERRYRPCPFSSVPEVV